MRFTFDLAEEDVAEMFLEMQRSDLLAFLAAIDLRIADVEFTEDLIKQLAKSIRGDLNSAEYGDLLADLAKIGAR